MSPRPGRIARVHRRRAAAPAHGGHGVRPALQAPQRGDPGPDFRRAGGSACDGRRAGVRRAAAAWPSWARSSSGRWRTTSSRSRTSSCRRRRGSSRGLGVALAPHRPHLGDALRDARRLRALHRRRRAARRADRLLAGPAPRALSADRADAVGAQDRHRPGADAPPRRRRGVEGRRRLPRRLLSDGGRHRHGPRRHAARAARPEPLVPRERAEDVREGPLPMALPFVFAGSRWP